MFPKASLKTVESRAVSGGNDQDLLLHSQRVQAQGKPRSARRRCHRKEPSEKAGLKEATSSSSSTQESQRQPSSETRVARTQPGDTVPLKVLRDGSTRALRSQSKKCRPGTLCQNDNTPAAPRHNGTSMGYRSATSTARPGSSFDLPRNVNGVVVTDVAPDSAAAKPD